MAIEKYEKKPIILMINMMVLVKDITIMDNYELTKIILLAKEMAITKYIMKMDTYDKNHIFNTLYKASSMRIVKKMKKNNICLYN